MKQLQGHSPEIPQVLWKNHPAPSLKSLGWLWRVLWAPCAITTEVPPARQKSQAGARQLVSCTSAPAPPNLQEMPPSMACHFQAHTVPLPTATRPVGQAGSLLSSKKGVFIIVVSLMLIDLSILFLFCQMLHDQRWNSQLTQAHVFKKFLI